MVSWCSMDLSKSVIVYGFTLAKLQSSIHIGIALAIVVC